MRRFLQATLLLAACWLGTFSLAAAQDGQALFKANCASCHKVTDARSTGPGLQGVAGRWNDDRAEMVKFIRGGAAAYAGGNNPNSAHVKALIAEYGTVMPAQPISEADANAILDYVANAAGAGNTTQQTQLVDPRTNLPNHHTESLFGGLSILIGVLLFAVIALVVIIAVVLIALRAKEEGTRFQMSHVSNFLASLKRNKFLVGTLGFIVFLFLFTVLVNYLRDVGLHQGYQPVQPIAFSHALHAGQYEIDCEYCHTGVRRGKSATIPSTNICQNCHHTRGGIVESQYQFNGDANFNATAEIAKVLASAANNTPIEWVRIHNLPDFVYFNHSQHVAVAGLECQQCHGPVQTMDEVYQFSVLSMGWCVNCHRSTEVDITKSEYYRSIHGSYLEPGNEQRITVETLGGLNCARCHY
jgi:predicted CXXCH cytochrome family protein